ncbi:MAG TPA: prolipoprotein diacylglyceryl transferase [Azospirillaceae bacterium]|nr:prolipoprotein diacylglyceryl transferase [Azospirillaceae bacterium]
MLAALAFPDIDPVALQIGPFALRWYALAYIVGVVLGWWYASKLNRRKPEPLTSDHLGDFASWAILGILIGGRLGSVLFYNLPYYLENPLEVFFLWQGGMSFHGGLLGIIAAVILFARRHGFSPFVLGDLVAACGPIGLFLGRIANFVNGELWGRQTDVAWAVVFPDPRAGAVPRHPSQLYEAVLEGIVLFVVLWLLSRRREIMERHGILCGVFFIGYGLSRIIVEFFREPDAQLGYLAGVFTMGQLLSLPMVLVGIWMIARAKPSPAPAHAG